MCRDGENDRRPTLVAEFYQPVCAINSALLDRKITDVLLARGGVADGLLTSPDLGEDNRCTAMVGESAHMKRCEIAKPIGREYFRFRPCDLVATQRGARDSKAS